MRNRVNLVVAIGLGSALSTTALAADLPSLKQLLGAGYEIKAVTYIGLEANTAMGSDPKTPQMMVTLQRGSAIAVCQYAASNWSTLAAASVEGVTQCDVYPKDSNPR